MVELYAREGCGGDIFAPKGKMSHHYIKIGMDDEWSEVVSTLLHEAFELAAIKRGGRFVPAPDLAKDNGDYQFVLSHTQFSNLCSITGTFMTSVMEDLSKEYKKWNKEST